MERTLRLLAFNFILTAATVTACLVVGWVVGAVSASILYPERKLVRQQYVPAYENQKKHAEHVDWVLTFATWSGLAMAQSVFLVLHLGRDAQPTDRKIGSNR